MKKLIWVFLPVIAIGFLVVSSLPAKAASFTFEYEIEFSGATPPVGATPWITATFDDSYGGADTVRLTMSADNLVGTEFIEDWYFNFDDTLNPTSLSFSAVGTFTPVAIPNSISTGVDAFKAGGSGYYDILFDFPPPTGNSPNKFTAGESVMYDINYESDITVASFNVENSSGYRTVAHILAINGEESGFVSVPDASVMLLLVPSLIGLVGFGRRKVKK